MKWKPFTVMVLVLAGGVLPPVFAADEAVVEAAVAEDATLDGLRAEYDAAYRVWVGKIRAAKGREARDEMMKDRPSPTETVEKMVPLITAQADDPAVLKHVAWVVQMERSNTPDAVAEVLEKHRDSAEVAQVVLVASTSLEGRIAEVLDGIRENSKQGKVKAAMAFIKAQDRGLAEDEKLALLKEVLANAGDLEARGRKLVDSAEAGIFELEHLSIGQVAGEIEGEDQDGVAFKLSDYRGKVVVLDFWGDW